MLNDHNKWKNSRIYSCGNSFATTAVMLFLKQKAESRSEKKHDRICKANVVLHPSNRKLNSSRTPSLKFVFLRVACCRCLSLSKGFKCKLKLAMDLVKIEI